MAKIEHGVQPDIFEITRFPNTAISGIDQHPNSRNTGSAAMQEWETTQKNALCTMDDASCFLDI